MFETGLKIGQVLRNSDIVSLFKCGNMGGMRRSKKTNTLVLISDYTKGIYHDKWIGGVLHYTGMGKSGDQDIEWAQNRILKECGCNGVDVHLFEVMDAGKYIYCGRVRLVDDPYIDFQPGDDGIRRRVWMFPIRPVPDNNVKKPPMFVFKDMNDYKIRGKDIDAKYMEMKIRVKKFASKNDRNHVINISSDKNKLSGISTMEECKLIGKKINHKSYGEGIITDYENDSITVLFESVGRKRLGYKFCIDSHLFTFI